MSDEINAEKIKQELNKAMHPEINFSLIELGMIGNIKINNLEVSIELLVPFLNVPIKNDLVKLIENAVKKIDEKARVEVNLIEMNEQQKIKFFELAKKGWLL